MNSENCWKPLRASALQRSEQSQTRKVEKSEDWAISSRADAKAPEGSTTRVSNLTLNRMYAGMTTRQIAAELNVSPRTATRMIHAAGIKARKPGEKPSGNKLRDEQWLRLEYAAKSAERIAQEIGCAPRTVVTALRKFGVEVQRTNLGRKFPEVGKRHSDWLKGRYTGDKNPNWRGGAVKKYSRERASYQAKQWSKQVRERDGFKCVKCGETGKLHAHHVVPWLKDRSRRFDVSNGITLCVPCHQLEHRNRFAKWSYGENPTSTGRP